ncbi:unnamed protein product [Schistosoma margrebowiei]|uniref:Uncharacterized protein n=1 Tax=Schistosoma margrebowiei TaxID=48269 RepID=A0A183LTA6_9TREM|nr:unnamed protein product [Schistosoma margrebowiei]
MEFTCCGRETISEGETEFNKCLFSGKLHFRNSCPFRNAKCLKYGEIGHIQSVCHTTVHFAATDAKICNSDSVKLGLSDSHLHLSTTSKSGIESHGRPKLNETLYPYETTVSNQSPCQISHVIVPDMVFPNDSHISDAIPYKSEENMLSKPNHDKKSDVVLVDADFSNDPSRCDDILNKFEETISEELNLDVISNVFSANHKY